MQRRVVCSAIRWGGVNYCGARHHHCIALIRALGIKETQAVFEQGFVDQWNVYMSRAEAKDVAESAGQIVKKHAPESELFSEDLY